VEVKTNKHLDKRRNKKGEEEADKKKTDDDWRKRTKWERG
jgi:hypothetical protein